MVQPQKGSRRLKPRRRHHTDPGTRDEQMLVRELVVDGLLGEDAAGEKKEHAQKKQGIWGGVEVVFHCSILIVVADFLRGKIADFLMIYEVGLPTTLPISVMLTKDRRSERSSVSEQGLRRFHRTHTLPSQKKPA